tara:strand:+ start:1321 stop:1812 length:492 start_codon:yes stop_codon:yes gene_type:complete
MAFVFRSTGTLRLPSEITVILSDFTDERHINRSKLIKTLVEKSEKFIMGENPKFGINNFPCLEDEHRIEVFARYYCKQLFNKINPPDSQLNKDLRTVKDANTGPTVFKFKYNTALIDIMSRCHKLSNSNRKYKSFNYFLRKENDMVNNLGELVLLNIHILWKF